MQFNIYGSGQSGGVDFSDTHHSGFGITENGGTGALTGGNFHTPSSRWSDTGGGVNASVNAAPWLGLAANQGLILGLTFDADSRKGNFGPETLPFLNPGPAGSVRREDYTVTGSVDYKVNGFYASSEASVEWGHSNITNNSLTVGAQGSTDLHGYSLFGEVGELLPLFGSIAPPPKTKMITKAPPAAAPGYAVALDISGHLAYENEHVDGFVDNTGFVYGPEKLSYGVAGAQAELLGIFPNGGLLWLPHAGVSIDQQFSYSHTFFVPNQPAAVQGTFFLTQAHTFYGVESGLGVAARNGVTAGINGFYSASSDLHSVGGSLFVKIPFFAEPVLAAKDNGIRVLPK